VISPATAPPVALAAWGSFHVGGREVAVSGEPLREVPLVPGSPPLRLDPNGTYLMGAMYAQYGTVPLLFWHGGGLSGASWETTPDGREGWQHFFLRQGWTTIVSDAVERGRAGWTLIPEQTGGAPVLLPARDPWERFRIGDGPGSHARGTAWPGGQFPVEAYENLIRQIVPRFTTTDSHTLEAYLALLDRVGPAAIIAHSQGGVFAHRAARERPDLVRALVLIEPASIAEPEPVTAPLLLVYCDRIAEDARWPAIRASGLRLAEAQRAGGGLADVLDLPAQGVRGNSHMLMMDRNSDDVASLAQAWFAGRGLWG
jgi:pimeloyl-ACP methyl ester carboxylesterase